MMDSQENALEMGNVQEKAEEKVQETTNTSEVADNNAAVAN